MKSNLCVNHYHIWEKISDAWRPRVFGSEAHFIPSSLQTSLLLAITPGIREITMYTFQPSMSNTRQTKQSSQLPADISHLGSKSQENNKPLENLVHQTYPRREVKQQINRHYNQENERQETKQTPALPVYAPKNSSFIQPTSDPVPPPDRFFKPQEATCVPFSFYLHIVARALNYFSSAKS
jgi:hypothetical protein